MSSPSAHHFRRFCEQTYQLQDYFASPGDGRCRPQIPAGDLLWSLVMGLMLRQVSHHGLEGLLGLAFSSLGVGRSFGDDSLNYFEERLSVTRLRRALIDVAHLAKRKKAFQDSRFIGLALDGTGAGHTEESHCELCRELYGDGKKISGYGHKFSALCVVGTGLTLPLDVEPFGPGDSEAGASRRLLERAAKALGPYFADYVVADGAYGTAPFLHLARDLGLKAVVCLKENLPLLLEAARARFERQKPLQHIEIDGEQFDLWDAEDFDPWETLNWETVRVLKYRRLKADGEISEGYWLTDWEISRVGTRALLGILRNRWEIENQVFNEAKARYGLEHIPHHEPNSLRVHWLLVMMTLTLERLYRLRHLHRGNHRPRTGQELCMILWLALGNRGRSALDTS